MFAPLRLDKREKGLCPSGLWLPVPSLPPTVSWILGSRSVFDFGFSKTGRLPWCCVVRLAPFLRQLTAEHSHPHIPGERKIQALLMALPQFLLSADSGSLCSRWGVSYSGSMEGLAPPACGRKSERDRMCPLSPLHKPSS